MTPEEVERYWQIAVRDDCFNHMVPSDVRGLIAEIRRLRDVLGEIVTCPAGCENCRSIARKSL